MAGQTAADQGNATAVYFAGVFFANYGDGGNLYDATENVCRNVGTAWMITEVFTENLFTTVLGLDARLYG